MIEFILGVVIVVLIATIIYLTLVAIALILDVVKILLGGYDHEP